MGGGYYSKDTYTSVKASKTAAGIPDFAYSAKNHGVHAELDPIRINKYKVGKLESRDSVDHPESNPFVIGFDVTGSNFHNAVVAQKKFPNLMELLTKYIPDPQLSIAANDDYFVEPHRSVQISQFESDNTIDKWIDLIKLVSNGGGNSGESYDLLLYAVARKTVTDAWEVRGKKGYMFMYADERIFNSVLASQVKAVFGDDLQGDIPIGNIIEELKERWNVFVLCPESSRSVHDSYDQYVSLFGEDNVVMLQDANMICEQIAALVGLNEGKTTATTAVQDLVAVGVDSKAAHSLVKTSIDTLKTATAKASGTLPVVGKGGASRL